MAIAKLGTGVRMQGNIRWKITGDTRTLKSGFQLQGPEVVKATLQHYDRRALPEAMESGAHRVAQAMVDYAQPHAPWTDRTREARARLHPVVARVGDRFSGGVAHGVDYGVWLEVRWNGRYAILLPTQEVFLSRAGQIFSAEVRAAQEGRPTRFRARGVREVSE